MRQGIHPEYTEIKATCSCGNIIVINSTLKEDINLDVCSSCHPFYTGKQKLVDTGGRVERFEKRFGKKGKTENKKKEEPVKELKVDSVDQVKAEEVKEKAPKKAKNRSRRTFEPNLHTHKFWIESEKRYVKLTVSAKGMRIIDKKGIDKVLSEIRLRGEKI